MSSQTPQARAHYWLYPLVCSPHKITVNFGGIENKLICLVLFHSLRDKLLRPGI